MQESEQKLWYQQRNGDSAFFPDNVEGVTDIIVFVRVYAWQNCIFIHIRGCIFVFILTQEVMCIIYQSVRGREMEDKGKGKEK